MPSMEYLSEDFVNAFVTECNNQGLSKEASFQLLQLRCLEAACRSDAYLEGFHNAIDRAMLEPMSKEASAVLKSVGKFMRRPGVVGTAAAAGGVGLGAKLFGDKGGTTAPTLLGDYDAAGAAAAEASRVAGASSGVASLNKQVSRDFARKRELEGVVNSNGPGAAAAIRELQGLRKQEAPKASKNYLKSLDSSSSTQQRDAGSLAGQQADLAAERDSWLGKLKSKLGLGNYDAKEQRLVADSARVAEDSRLTSTLRRRLLGGYTGGDDTEVLTPQELQSRFFPAR